MGLLVEAQEEAAELEIQQGTWALPKLSPSARPMIQVEESFKSSANPKPRSRVDVFSRREAKPNRKDSRREAKPRGDALSVKGRLEEHRTTASTLDLR